ncbi:DNA polymerase family B-domain-containing protein [Radiomyces spectabilis]|uniref:DNA polymerase family B-domain-containing protein n=1 Tax=Radiomyces spectabilis TaxID=64574 RepID=UPI00221E7DB6|nr:DNA polymerase family B-domain-containing protein [Radiomyces spectabilis]KAI8373058.1 DNA polymerase family B-domain-containing protein [Radiomyces spectabilis]
MSSPTMRRKRLVQSNDKKDRLKQLIEARKNRSRADLYQTKNEDDIYDQVTNEEYDMIQDDEDFVEDDDNAGYVHGDPDEDERMYSDEYDDENKDTGKRKRKDAFKKEKMPKPEQRINRFFQNSAVKTERKPKPPPVDAAESQDFMANLLSNFEAEVTAEIQRPRSSVIRPTMQQSSSRLEKIQPKPRPTARSAVTIQDHHPSPVVSEKPRSLESTESPFATTDQAADDDVYYDDDMDMDFAQAAMNLEVPPVIKKEEEVNDTMALDMTEPSDMMKFEDQFAEDVDALKVGNGNKSDEQNLKVFDEDGGVKFWWYDAYERREKGYVYLFGKVLDQSNNNYISCCVIVKNIERNLFVLPRSHRLDNSGNATDEVVTIADVYSELSEVCTKYRITKWASKSASRKYAFEIPGIPAEADYLKVVYAYDQPALPSHLKGATFSHVFGTNTGPLEHFLIKRDIMGPCWLHLTGAEVSNINESWCKLELIVNDPKTCNPLRDVNGNTPTHVPPLVVMSLSLRTIMNPQKNTNEIIAASAMVCQKVQIDEPTPIDAQQKTRFAVVRNLANAPYPAGFTDLVAKEKQAGFPVQVERSESALLNYLLARIYTSDPDVIVGHNFAGFDLDVLLHRMKALNTPQWHKLGRLKRKMWPKLQSGAGGVGESTYQEKMIMSGRLICDTYLTSKDLIRSKSYRLTDLAQSQLKITREDIQFDKTASYYEQASTLVHLIRHCAFDAFLSASLMFKLQVLPLTRQLTNLAGNLWSRTMTGARAERNEFLLLHEFHRQKFICPDKSFGGKSQEAVIEAVELDRDEDAEQMQTKKKSSRRKPAYTGGLVLEPKKGFYDKYVLLLDFNSLYPSIIQEYNVCFTTVQRHGLTNESTEREAADEEKVPEIPDSSTEQGVLPRLIKTLVDRRRQVKSLMKDPKLSEAEMMQYDIRQKALKLTANSMYGCLGFSHSRFYAKPLAMLITHKGREILQNTVDLAGSLDLNVIYGDTDSIMVYTNQDDIAKVKEMGYMLKRRVNELYKLLEIDIDGLFKHMLLLKKKKYAALLVEEKANGEIVETVETKGLDLVRRDWCDLSHDVSSRVLKSILSDKDREEVVEDIHNYLRQVGEEIRQGGIPLEKFIINKQLTKNPEEYADAKSQPHVQVALRMRQAGQSIRAGDTIPYVICQVEHLPNGAKQGFAEKAYHPDDVKHGEKQLDIEWYLNQQVHPPVARLCSPIEGTDVARIAECLGLDGSKYHVIQASSFEENEDFATLDSQISDEERFKNAEKLVVKCNHCQGQSIFDGIVRKRENDTVECGLYCTVCQQMIGPSSLQIQLTLAIRSYIRRYYDGWLVCDDTVCDNRTRMISVFGRRCLNQGCRGHMAREYSDKQLYTQLLYFSHMLDPVKAKSKASGTAYSIQVEAIVNQHYQIITALKATVERYLQRSGYRHVNLVKLMGGISLV